MSDTPDNDSKPLRKRRDVLRVIAAGGLATAAPLAGCSGGSNDSSGGDGSPSDGGGDGSSSDGGEAGRPSDGGDGSPSDGGEDGTPNDGGGDGSSSDGGGSGGTGLPAYHQYLPNEMDRPGGMVFYTLNAVDYREFLDSERQIPPVLAESFSFEQGEGDSSEDESEADPMLTFPGSGLFVIPFTVAIGLSSYGFNRQVLPAIHPSWTDEESEDGESPHRVDMVATWSGVVVLKGMIDAKAIVDAAGSFEQTGERGGFEVYEGPTSESGMAPDNPAFAVNGSHLIVTTPTEEDKPPGSIDDALDVTVGNTERLSETSNAGWAMETAGHGLTAIGMWGDGAFQQSMMSGEESSSSNAISSTTGLVSSLTSGDGEVQTSLAAVYPEGETPDRETIETDLSPSADDVKIEIDGTRLRVTTRYAVEERTPQSTGSGG